MSFFVTSQGPGEGANLGGLGGADAHCQQLAEAAGAGGKTWRAYLSTSSTDARDRIGTGPWHNADGECPPSAISDMTCDDWTSNGDRQAMVGHRDRMGCATMLLKVLQLVSSVARVQPGQLAVDRRRRAFYCFAVAE